MCSEYVFNRSGDGDGGDILKLVYGFYPEDTYIYDVDMFVPLVYSEEVDNEIMPNDFKVPAPFPIMWWDDVFRYGDVIHPNFDLFEDQMEYVSDIPLPETVLHTLSSYESDYVDPITTSSALRFEWRGSTADESGLNTPARVYHIYFVDPQTGNKVSYETVLATIHSPRTAFEAVDDVSILNARPVEPSPS